MYSTRKSPRAERKARHRRRVRLLRRRTDFSNLFVVRRVSYVEVKARYSYFRLTGAELESVLAVCICTNGMHMHMHVHMQDARPPYVHTAIKKRLLCGA